jgi:hypothetical protein
LPLAITTIEIDDCGTERMAFFSSVTAALEHLCDHVLTRPESERWQRLFRVVSSNGPDFSNTEEKRRLASSIWKEDSEQAQVLYDQYSRASSEAFKDASRLRWKVTRSLGGRQYGYVLGLNGIVAISDAGTVVTAFIPNFDDRFIPNCPAPTAETPLPREVRHLNLYVHTRGDRRRQREMERCRREKWDNRRQLFEWVFKPAIRFVSKVHCGAFSKGSQTMTAGCGALVDAVSQYIGIDYKKWEELWDGHRNRGANA